MKRTIITVMLALVALTGQAKKKVKGMEAPQLTNYPSADMSQLPLHGGEVVIQGRVIAEDTKAIEELNGTIEVIMRDYIIGTEDVSLLEFKSDGSFMHSLWVPFPMFVLVYPLTNVYACPGDTLDILIDTTKPKWKDEGITVCGTGLSGEVSKRYESIRKAYCNFSEDNNDEDETPEALTKWRDVQVARLDDLVRKMNAGLPELEGCSPLVSDILRTYIISEHMERICDRIDETIDDEDLDKEAFWKEYFSFVAPRERYLMDNPLMMIGADDFFFSAILCTLMRPALESLTSNDMNSCKMAMDGFADRLNLSPSDFSIQVCLLHIFSSMLNFYGLNQDNATDDEAIKLSDIVAEEAAKTISFLTYPELQRQAVLLYHKHVRAHELKAGEERPATKGDSIFQRIIEPYKGNVLYVDFWSTSCNPCCEKMLQMRDEVERNKDKPVKYLYITYDAEAQCRHFLERNNIKGEHIYVTKSEWGYLQAKFQISFIPFIVLYDKDGKRRDGATVDELLKEISSE